MRLKRFLLLDKYFNIKMGRLFLNKKCKEARPKFTLSHRTKRVFILIYIKFFMKLNFKQKNKHKYFKVHPCYLNVLKL